jgi:hypothetical protein
MQAACLSMFDTGMRCRVFVNDAAPGARYMPAAARHLLLRQVDDLLRRRCRRRRFGGSARFRQRARALWRRRRVRASAASAAAALASEVRRHLLRLRCCSDAARSAACKSCCVQGCQLSAARLQQLPKLVLADAALRHAPGATAAARLASTPRAAHPCVSLTRAAMRKRWAQHTKIIDGCVSARVRRTSTSRPSCFPPPGRACRWPAAASRAASQEKTARRQQRPRKQLQRTSAHECLMQAERALHALARGQPRRCTPVYLAAGHSDVGAENIPWRLGRRALRHRGRR